MYKQKQISIHEKCFTNITQKLKTKIQTNFKIIITLHKKKHKNKEET